MPNLFLEKSIEIAAPRAKVWSVFTDPKLSQRMGGEYVTDWEAGSSIRWKSGGTMRTDGKILKIEPGRLLKHNLFRDIGGVATMTSVITYELRGPEHSTTLSARESFAEVQDAKAFAEASKGWDEALSRVKEIAES